MLSNSIKHTLHGGSIFIHLEHDPEGIPPDELPFILDRFYRGDETRRRDVGGSRLGLAITKKIGEELQGSIKVQSEPGKGSTFTVYIPVFSAKIENR